MVKRSLSVTILSLCILLLTSCATDPARGKLSVTVLDVGQGDSIVVTTPGGRVILIDGGGANEMESMEHTPHLSPHDPDASDDDSANSDPHDVGHRVVLPYLHYRGINTIDLMVLTHPHGDHVGGLPAVLNDERVGAVLDGTVLPYPSRAYRAFRELVAAKHIPYRHAARGMHIDFGDSVTADVLNPPAHGTPYGVTDDNSTVNNYSVVLRLNYGSTHMLLDGDAEKEAEASMIASGADLSGDFLKCGHHGAGNATSDAWLDAVHPNYAAISCGLHNIFGHPHPDTLARLAAHNVAIYRTDHNGAITAISDGHGIVVSVVDPGK